MSRLWFRTLRRRDQTRRLNWQRMHRIITRWLPPPNICHPYKRRKAPVGPRVTSRGFGKDWRTRITNDFRL
ncbi:TPA: hypothetical protein QDB19_000381 [Burkholderia vietnamiensis]|nr:hypothetical protein [Burkholderia vietnamiensis]